MVREEHAGPHRLIRPMRLRLAPVFVVVLGACTVWLVFETRRLAELAGGFEIAARDARAEAAAAQNEAEASRSSLASAGAEVTRLEGELMRATQQLSTMAETVQKRAEHEAARAASSAEADALSLAAMPEGVRACLASLHECLRAEGFTNQRFLSARALDGDGLHEVEMLDTQMDGFGVDFVRAGKMVAELDRAKGRLVLRFFEGTRTVAGERVEFGPDGWAIVFEPIDARMFEERLPYLMRPEGVYPDDSGAAPRRPVTDLDPITRMQWLDRFDHLLAEAGTAEELRINRCRGLQDGHFLSVQLLGTDSMHRLLSSADCQRMAVEVDQSAGVVSLLLQNGVLRRGGVESTITAEGYRMLLPKVTPSKAIDVMLGMVVTK
jgi:hypothetical protein